MKGMSLQKLRKIARQLGFITHLKMGYMYNYISIMYICIYPRLLIVSNTPNSWKRSTISNGMLLPNWWMAETSLRL